jgi:ribonuclease Z
MAKKFEVTIIGINSASPVHGRYPSCQIVNYDDQLFMVDCGEASQIQLSKYSIKKNKVNHIFISHLHGDHCYGLPGLISSYALQGRRASLNLHGPIGIKNFLNVIFDASGVNLPFDLKIFEYNTELPTVIEIGSTLLVNTFPLKHRIPTMGFRFIELIDEANLRPDAIKEYKLNIEEIKAAKKGKSIFRNGNEIPNSLLTLPKPKPRSYAYCSDTIYDTEVIDHIKGSTVLYHETTYLDDLEILAKERMHTTLGQAIKIAKSSNIENLIIGHYSSRYKNTNVFLEKGLPLFSGLLLGEEGKVYKI